VGWWMMGNRTGLCRIPNTSVPTGKHTKMTMSNLEAQLEHLYAMSTWPDLASQAISLVFDITEGGFAERNIDQVNEYLGKLDVKRAAPRVLVASLRSTFRAKAVLSHWHPLLIATHAELTSQGLDADRLLRGLM
jgi:hypothetical protein